MRQKRLMVVGGGPWQVPLIQKARAMGLFVINSNLFPDSPGFRYADVGLVADILDREKQLEFAREYQPDGIVTDQSDIAIPTVAYLCESLHLVGIGTAKARLFTDKYQMREFLRERGYPTPEYVLCRSRADAGSFAAKAGYPIVIKPPANQGSRGVFRVNNASEIASRYEEASRLSSDQRVLAEQFLPGPEMTVEGFKVPSRHYSLAVARKIGYPHNPMLVAEQVYSPAAEGIDFEALKKQNDAMVEAMGLEFGITHAEYIYSDGRFFLVEIAARGGGNYISSYIVPTLSGVETNELLIRLSLGEKVDALSLHPNRLQFVMLGFFNFKPGIVKDIRGMETARSVPGVVDIVLSVQPGQRLEPPRDGPTRHGQFIAISESMHELESLRDRIQEEVQIDYV